jgi:hypothetical protein
MIGTIALLVTAPSAFKCAIDMNPRMVTSADGKTTVVAEFEGKLSIYKKGSRHAVAASKWSRFGHHYQLLMSPDASAIVIHDAYGGVEVFDGTGRQVALLKPDKFLTAAEKEDIPGKWACHPEGTWYEKPAFAFEKGKVTFATFSGRKIEVALKRQL